MNTHRLTLALTFLAVLGGWLNYPEYFLPLVLPQSGRGVFNTMSYKNPSMDRLIEAARFEMDPKKYAEDVKGSINLADAEVPRIPLAQPYFDVAMQQSLGGYSYWFHIQPDYRLLTKK